MRGAAVERYRGGSKKAERKGISGARSVVSANAKCECRNKMDSRVVVACVNEALLTGTGVSSFDLDSVVDLGERILEK